MRFLLVNRSSSVVTKDSKHPSVIDAGMIASGLTSWGHSSHPQGPRRYHVRRVGLATLAETSRRVAASKGLVLRNIDGLIFSPDLPKIMTFGITSPDSS
jgi:hypothetical protein